MVDTLDSSLKCPDRVFHPRFRAIVQTALTSPLNRHVVRVARSWDDSMLATSQGQNELVVHHVLHGGLGPLTPAAQAYLERLRKQ